MRLNSRPLRRGASGSEYGLGVGLVGAAALAALLAAGGEIEDLVNRAKTEIATAAGSVAGGTSPDENGPDIQPPEQKAEQGDLPHCLPGNGAKFGYWLDIDGDDIVVGATGANGAHDGSGVACLYSATSRTLKYILAPSGDGVGTGVSVGGGYAIVGAPHTSNDTGAAFTFTTSNGAAHRTLQGDDTLAGDRFGYATDVDSGIIVVGAPEDDNVRGTDAGGAYLFDATTGNQRHKLLPGDANDDEQFGMRFGKSVAIDDGLVAVGAWRDAIDGVTDVGSVYIFDATTGNQLRKITPSDAEFAMNLGFTVALDGNVLAVSAHGQDDASGSSTGAVHVYNVATGEKTHHVIMDGTSNLGQTLALEGNTVVVGERNADGTTGAVHLYDLATRQFYQTLIPDAVLSNSYFGTGLGISNDVIVSGAPFHWQPYSMNGAAWVFE